MDRSRRQAASGARPATAPPASSRLTVRKYKNRRRPGSTWSRFPKPAAIADACGRALRRSLRAVALVCAIGAMAGSAWAGHRWLMTSPRFAITSIAVSGAHRVDAARLRAELPVRIGDNVFADLTAIARVARTDPWVASAEVHRILPHTIAIELREHTAAAVVELGERYLADPEGQPFKRIAPSDLAALDPDGDGAPRLPLITGLTRAAYTADPQATARTVRDAIAAAGHWRAAGRPALGGLELDPHGVVTLRTADPAIAILLGGLGGGLDARIRMFDVAWAGLSEAERSRTRAVHLDARSDHVTVAFAKEPK